MIVPPPEYPGVNDTVAVPTPVEVDEMLGAPGSASGVPEPAGDAAPSPTTLLARICNEYKRAVRRARRSSSGDVVVAAVIQRAGAVELVLVRGRRAPRDSAP